MTAAAAAERPAATPGGLNIIKPSYMLEMACSGAPHVSLSFSKAAAAAYIDGMLRRAQHRTWCQVHGKTLPPPRLSPVILRVIREWFDLVDDDGSGTLEHHELLAALQAARIPCDADSISEMIRLMDANRDGCIGWNEFEAFMMDEFAAGKSLLSGEYVLPSGMALPFGVMIRQLKRTQMLSEITQGGEARRKWLHYNIDLTADAAAISEAEDAIRLQKAYDTTLHNREVVQPDPSAAGPGNSRLDMYTVPGVDQAGSDPSSSIMGQFGAAAKAAADMVAAAAPGDGGSTGPRLRSGGSSSSPARRASATAAAADEKPGSSGTKDSSKYKGVRMPSWMSRPNSAAAAGNNGSSTAAAATHQGAAAVGNSSSRQTGSTAAPDEQLTVTVVAGVPVVAAAGVGQPPAAAAAGHRLSAVGGVQALTTGSPQKSMPFGVPRLQLGSISGSGGSNSAAPWQQQQRQESGYTSPSSSSKRSLSVAAPGVEAGSVLAAGRSSYWLRPVTAGAAAAAAAGSSSSSSSARDSVADHLYQQAAAAGIPLERLGSGAAAVAVGNRCGSPCCGSPRQQQQQQQQQRQSLASPRHGVQPQPSKDEWGVLAASSFAQSHTQRCEAETHCSVGSASPRAKSPRLNSPRSPRLGFNSPGLHSVQRHNPSGIGRAMSADKAQLQQWQHQTNHKVVDQVTSHNAAHNARHSSTGGSAAAVQAAVLAAAQHSDGNYREAGVKHLLSAKPVPPAMLLSPDYVGPVTAAVAAAHTPRIHYEGMRGSTNGVDAAAAAAAGKSPRQHHSSTGSSSRPSGAKFESKFLGSNAGRAAIAEAAGEMLGGSGVAEVPGTVGKVLVATNIGGAVMTHGGQVLTYVQTPRQHGFRDGDSGRGPDGLGRLHAAESCIGQGLMQLKPPADTVNPAVSSTHARSESKVAGAPSSGSGSGTARAAGAAAATKRMAVANTSNTGAAGPSNPPHSPRHSMLAQHLVKPHLAYNSKVEKQQAPQEQQPVNAASSSGSSCGVLSLSGSVKSNVSRRASSTTLL